MFETEFVTKKQCPCRIALLFLSYVFKLILFFKA